MMEIIDKVLLDAHVLVSEQSSDFAIKKTVVISWHLYGHSTKQITMTLFICSSYVAVTSLTQHSTIVDTEPFRSIKESSVACGQLHHHQHRICVSSAASLSHTQ